MRRVQLAITTIICALVGCEIKIAEYFQSKTYYTYEIKNNLGVKASVNNLILMIGDGMGREQIRAASLFKNRTEDALSFQHFPYKGEVTTYSKDKNITDSAAAASAMATGIKVYNGELSNVKSESQSLPVKSWVEYCQDKGKRIGLVTTAKATAATPGAFIAHVENRYLTGEIVEYILEITKPDLLFAGNDINFSKQKISDAGYNLVRNRKELLSLTPSTLPILGLFGYTDLPYVNNRDETIPSLEEMSLQAIKTLSNNAGFCLVIEGGRIDHAGHLNNIEYLVGELLEFERTATVIADWVGKRDDALLLVTADHETGGLSVTAPPSQPSYLPEVSWQTSGHTLNVAPVYGLGKNAEFIPKLKDNTDIFSLFYHSL